MKTLANDVVLVGSILIVGACVLSSSLGPSWYGSPHSEEGMLFLAFLLGLLFAWNRGKLKAAERLRALELGRSLAAPAPGSEPDWALPRIVIAAGGWVLFALFGLFWVASRPHSMPAEAVWNTASILGVTALICGTILGWRFLGAAPLRGQSARQNGRGSLTKPDIDPDTLDVVGRRGSDSPTFPLHNERRF